MKHKKYKGLFKDCRKNMKNLNCSKPFYIRGSTCFVLRYIYPSLTIWLDLYEIGKDENITTGEITEISYGNSYDGSILTFNLG